MKALKVALIFISVILLGLGPIQVGASEPAKSYEDLAQVIEAVVDASWDLPAGPHWKLHSLKQSFQGCEVANPDWIYEQIAAGIENFASFYVDEELPYAHALEQLQELASSGAFQVCEGAVVRGPIPFVIEL